MRALIVDDSKTMRRIVGKVVKENGFETIIEAENGEEALLRLRDGSAPPVALALVDWNMPEMCGVDFVTAIRQQEAFNGMRIVMVTTESETVNVERAYAAGANGYMTKPFTADGLRAKLATLGFTD